MKGKYITKQILLACRVKPKTQPENVYVLLEETLAERKRLLQGWNQCWFAQPAKDIHALLQETIAERKRILQQWDAQFMKGGKNIYFSADKKAA